MFTSGPFVLEDVQTALVLFYGTLGDDPTTFARDNVPLYHKPYVTLIESAEASRFRPGIGSYVPPAGSVFLSVSGQTGVLHLDGLHVTIDAADEQAILAAARALGPMTSQ